MSVSNCVSLWFCLFFNVSVFASLRLRFASLLVSLHAPCRQSVVLGVDVESIPLVLLNSVLSGSARAHFVHSCSMRSRCRCALLSRQTHEKTNRQVGKHRETDKWARVCSTLLLKRIVASCQVRLCRCDVFGGWRGVATTLDSNLFAEAPLCQQRAKL